MHTHVKRKANSSKKSKQDPSLYGLTSDVRGRILNKIIAYVICSVLIRHWEKGTQARGFEGLEMVVGFH